MRAACLGGAGGSPLLATTRASAANAMTPAECRAGSGRAARAPRGRESSRGASNMIVSSTEDHRGPPSLVLGFERLRECGMSGAMPVDRGEQHLARADDFIPWLA